MTIRPIAIALAAILAASALPADARPADKLAGVATPSGPAANCIRLPIRESRVRDDRTIDFFVGKQVYRNTLPYACPGLGGERAFSYATSISQLCSQDIITVLQRTGGSYMRGASCGLGTFQPIQHAGR